MLSQTRIMMPLVLALIAGLAVACMGESPGQDKAAWHPPIAAPVHYGTTAVILADKEGVASVTFRCPSADKSDVPATSDVVEYQYRYRSKHGVETSGNGVLYENRVTIVDGDKSGSVDIGGHLKLVAGHFQLEWSQGDAKQGWLYYAPESLRLQFTAAENIDKLSLGRFAR